jgi:hypothetical protein
MQGTLSDPFEIPGRPQATGTNHTTQLSYHRLFRAEPGDEPRRAVLAWACRQTEEVDHAAIEALAKAAVIPASDLSMELLACAVRLNAGDIDGISRLELCAERLRLSPTGRGCRAATGEGLHQRSASHPSSLLPRRSPKDPKTSAPRRVPLAAKPASASSPPRGEDVAQRQERGYHSAAPPTPPSLRSPS